jgi:hypothetical protein
VAIGDENGLDDAEAQEAVAWAIDTLIASLQPAASKAKRRNAPRPS